MLEDAHYRCSKCGASHYTKEAADACERINVPAHTFKLGEKIPMPDFGWQAVPIIELVVNPGHYSHERFVLVGTEPVPQLLSEDAASRYIELSNRRRL